MAVKAERVEDVQRIAGAAFYHILVLYLTEFILICSMMKISHDLFYLFDSRVCRDLFWHKFVVIYYLNHGKKYMDHDFFFCSSHLLHNIEIEEQFMTDQSQKYKNWTEYLLIEVYYHIKLRWTIAEKND
jgi:hypothetical protein